MVGLNASARQTLSLSRVWISAIKKLLPLPRLISSARWREEESLDDPSAQLKPSMQQQPTLPRLQFARGLITCVD